MANGLTATILLACAPGPTTPGADAMHGAPAEPARRTVVLIALDGVRWQDVFSGVDPALADRYHLPADERGDAATLVPNLHRLMTTDGAAIGAPGSGPPMKASGPNFLSLPGYMEMLTGRTDTGCDDNQCDPVSQSTVADDVWQAGLGEAAVIASWPKVGRAAAVFPESVVSSVGRHAGAGRVALQNDPCVGPALRAAEDVPCEPGHEDYRPDARTVEIATAYLDSHRPGFLFVGLGDTDEYAHRDDYRGYLRALHQADAFVGHAAEVARRRTAAGYPTTLLVTTDHGRARGFVSHGGEAPESARVWLVATGAGITARGHVASPAPRHLSDVGATARALLGLPRTQTASGGGVLTELIGAERTETARAVAAR